MRGILQLLLQPGLFVQATPTPHVGATVTEWILAFAAAVVSPLVTLFVMNRQNTNALRIAREQNDIALVVAQKQNANTLALGQEQNATALRVARQQVLADVVSASRRQWLGILRNTVARFQGTASLLYAMRETGGQAFTASDAARIAEKLTLVLAKLELLLNPSEEDHQKLATAARELLLVANAKPADSTKVVLLYRKVLDAGQRVLKREWERVKSEPTEW